MKSLFSGFEFHPAVIVRTPTFPISHIIDNITDDYLLNPVYLEALAIASPELAGRITGQHPNELSDELKTSLLKYYNRMCFRCTPFGLFAGCSVANWGAETNIVLAQQDIRRRTRLDNDYLSKIINQLNQSAGLFKYLRFSVNNTLYPFDQDFRMIDQIEGRFAITSVKSSETLQFFLNAISGRTDIEKISRAANANGYTDKDTGRYLKLLMDNHLIIPSTLTAGDATFKLKQLIKFLSAAKPASESNKLSGYLNALEQIEELFFTADRSLTDNSEIYAKLVASGEKFGLSQPANNVFQTDYVYGTTTNTISEKLKQTLLKGLNVLSLLTPDNTRDFLFNSFKNKFLKRYEQQEIPLLLALDPENGIDYLENHAATDNFLAAEFLDENYSEVFEERPESVNIRIFLHKYEQVQRAGEFIFELTDKDIAEMEPKEKVFPGSISVMFRMLGNDSIQIEQTGGSSGINLFSRFTHLSDRLHQLAREISDFEQQRLSGFILAEVIHEPEARAANVNAFLTLRKYQIPYYADPADQEITTIPLSDLVVAVRDNRVWLRSVRLNAYVIPIISSAYNYKKGSPIFRFLGEFQNQFGTDLGLDMLKYVPDKAFYPRVSFKNTVLWAATWKIQDSELEAGSANLLFKIQQLVKSRKLPRLFTISEGDNELLIDSQNSRLLLLLAEHLRKKKVTWLKEVLVAPNSQSVVNKHGELFNNQVVAILLNKNPPVNPPQELIFKTTLLKKPNRTFFLGSEWLYFKIYCGVVTADQLLASVVFELVKKLKKLKLIKKFFFIRYQDPDFHIRLRFQLSNLKHLVQVITEFQNVFASSQNTGQVYKVQTDTYVRELERYGDTIIESEKLFAIDSESILQLLYFGKGERDQKKRFGIAIRLVSDLLDAVNFTADEKIAFIRLMISHLRTDLQINAQTTKRLNKHLKEHEADYDNFIKNAKPIYEQNFNRRKGRLIRIFEAINHSQINSMQQVVDNHLLASHIHMSVNRVFQGNQKFYEYLAYEYLSRYYLKLAHAKAN